MKHLKTFESFSIREAVQSEAEAVVSKLSAEDLDILSSMDKKELEEAAAQMAQEIVEVQEESQKESLRFRTNESKKEMTPEEKKKATQKIKKILFALGFTVAGGAALAPFIITATGGVLTFAAVKAAILTFLGGAATAAGVVGSQVAAQAKKK